MLKRVITVACALALFSCREDGAQKKVSSVSKSAPKKVEYTLEQLDSIGRAFKPEIGKFGGVITLPLSADPDGFCPPLTNSGYSLEVIGNIYEGLITRNPATLEYEPHIAKEWKVSDDGLVWTFFMRDDVKFNDGTSLTAKDIVFTFNDVIYNEKLNSPLNYNFRIEGEKVEVEALDSLTVRFTLPKPFALFISMAGTAILPKHKYGEAAQKGELQSFLSAGAKPEDVVGSGPFMLKKVELGQHVFLKRNPYYWKKNSEGKALPYLDGITYLVVKDPNVQMMKFESGEIDQMAVEGKHYPVLKPKESDLNISLYRVGPRWYDAFIKFNQNNQKDEKGKPFVDPKKLEWFRTKEFRQACAYAINYEEIQNIIYNGLAYPPAGIWGKHKGKFHNPTAPLYYFDPKKADSLFNAIGMTLKEGEKYRRDKDGDVVEFTLMTSAGVKQIENTYNMVRKDLENIGIKMNLNLVEFNTLISNVQNTFQWEAVAFAMGGIDDPHWGKSSNLATSFRYTINPQRKDKKGNLIPKDISDWEKRVIEIFEAGAIEMDEQKRIALYQEWQAIEMEKCNTIYMPIKEVIIGVKNKFGNVHLHANLALSGSILTNVDEIYIK